MEHLGHGFLILCLSKPPPEPMHCRPKIKRKLPFLFFCLPPTQFHVTQQLIVPQKWQTTFLEAHEVQITKMLFPNFCLNSIQYFIADKEILSSRSLIFLKFLFWLTACSLRFPWRIKEIVFFYFFFISLTDRLLKTASRKFDKHRIKKPWAKVPALTSWKISEARFIKVNRWIYDK